MQGMRRAIGAEITFDDVFANHCGSESASLLLELHHHLWARDAVGEPWVVLNSYSFLLEAELARSNLVSAGFDARLNNAHTLSVQTFLSEPGIGIELMVPSSQKVAAAQLLDYDFSDDIPSDLGSVSKD